MGKDAVMILQKDGLSPATYFDVVNQLLPEEWMTWEPETVWSELEAVLGIDVDEISRATKNKIMAYRMAHNSSAPWEDWHVFLNTALAMNGVVPNTDTAQVISPSQVAWAVAKLTEIHPDWKFSESVRAIAAVMLYNDGVCWVPGLLGDIVNDHLFHLQRHYEALPDFVRGLAENYVDNMDKANVEGDSAADIHTARIKAMEQYVRAKQLVEEVAINV